MSDFESSRASALKRRLRGYAILSGCRQPGNRPVAHLTIGEHAILLGILKKVEAKNAVLAAVTAIIYAAALSVYKEIIWSVTWVSQGLLLSVILQGIAVVGALIKGADHISNLSAIRLDKRHLDDCCLAAEMQMDLMRNLLQKEARFLFATVLLTLGLLAVGIVVLWEYIIRLLT